MRWEDEGGFLDLFFSFFFACFFEAAHLLDRGIKSSKPGGNKGPDHEEEEFDLEERSKGPNLLLVIMGILGMVGPWFRLGKGL